MTDTNELQLICDADIIKAITDSTSNVFSTMLSMEVTSAEVMPPQSVVSPPASGLISLIGLAGRWAGTGSLACTAKFACAMSSQFLMTEYDSVNEDVLDAIAEITNMIIGNVKTALEEKIGEMGLSTPTVIFGRNFQTRSAKTHEWIVMRFVIAEHEMFIQMCLAPNKEASPMKNIRPGFQFPQLLSM
ncbi:MAG: chemotaxis protein CheX [Bryobacteraceae bacterium]